jgi:hypothetical protein
VEKEELLIGRRENADHARGEVTALVSLLVDDSKNPQVNQLPNKFTCPSI